jgi:hypothetical protein
MEKLNQWLTLAANVGVLVGIFFLAYEIRQNTEAVKSEALHTSSENARELLLEVATSVDIRTAIAASNSWDAAQDPYHDNYEAYCWWLWAVMRNLEEQYYLWKAGFLELELLNARVEALRPVFSEGGIQREWWPGFSASMTPEFTLWLSDHLELKPSK